jgi:Undecaprenyl-phosphate glucose phosphotransferase
VNVRNLAAQRSQSRTGPTGQPVSPVLWATLVAAIEFIVVSATALCASVAYLKVIYSQSHFLDQYVVASGVLGFLYVLICLVDEQYHLTGEKWTRQGIARGVGAISLAFTFWLAIAFLFKFADDYSRGIFLVQLVVVVPSLLLTRVALAETLRWGCRAGKFQGRALVVVSLTRNPTRQLVEQLCEEPDKITRWYEIETEPLRSAEGKCDALARKLSAIRAECRKISPDGIIIIFDAINMKSVARVAEAFFELPTNLQLVPVAIMPFMQRSRIAFSGRLHVLELLSRPFSLLDRFLKRTLDLIASVAAVIVLSPLLLLVSLAIKFDSAGPILFRQTRHGFNNGPIEVFKFRTMAAANEGAPFQQTTRNDPRVTRIGRILRKTSIDEFPQLLNVIRGEMSLVGPRPHAVAHNDAFFEQITLMARRHNMKPGITGWAQVNELRGETDTTEKMRLRVEYDLYYIDNWTLFFDVKILLKTVFSKRTFTAGY